MLQIVDPPFRTLHRDPVDFPPLLAIARWRRQGRRAALLTLVGIDGTSPRPLGAQMAVSEDGDVCGYFSGGCLEGELATVAREAIANGGNLLHRYGEGSPFIDIRLPCGSGIDVYFDQAIGDDILFEAESRLLARAPFRLVTDLADGVSTVKESGGGGTIRSGGTFRNLLQPRLRVHVYGTGYGAVQLARLIDSLGGEVGLYAPDGLTVEAAAVYGLDAERTAPGTSRLPVADPWTASVLMFHDHDRELPIFRHVLDGPSFYIGAVGSSRVQRQRIDALQGEGFSAQQLSRIVGPAGHVDGARSGTELAVGIYSQILETMRAARLVT